MNLLKVLLPLALIAAAIWWFTRDPVEAAYQKCLAKVEAGVKEAIPPGGQSAVDKAMADAMRGFGSAAGNAACEAMRDLCRKDRDGAMCKAAMAQF